MEKNDSLYALRHSAAHLLAHAVLELYPNTKITIGPVTENGFFYDFLPEENFKEEDLPRIEKKMRELSNKNYEIVGKQHSKDEARAIYKDNPFKLEIIDNVEEDTVGIYTQGNFSDLCKGGHTKSTGDVKHFKLMNLSGAYWRGDRDGVALQRISGIAFETKKELDGYLKRLEEAKLYDHRKLGRQLDLFSFHEEAAGCPFFHAKGLKVYNKLLDYSRHMHSNYQEVKAPLIMDEELWKTSGHYDNYRDNMYFTSIDDASHCIRPMNCPSSILIYKEKPHSYREFPLRMLEYGQVHRYELSGVLHGLFRVRTFVIDDAHIYCTPDQIEDEVLGVIKLANEVYNKFEFKKINLYLSTKPEKYIGSDEMWEKAEKSLEDALKRHGVPYSINEGDGAFYGPKIDMCVEDAIGRQWQCGTVQVDFFQPDNFDLQYIDSDQSRKRPVIIHRAIYGSIERFMGILIEHYKGHIPFWLAPEQIRVLTITDAQKDYAKEVVAKLCDASLRVTLDESNDQIGGQIRKAQMEKIPWMLVIGKKEVEAGTVTLRHNDGKQEFGLSLDDVIARSSS